ncbi:GTPase [Sulfodiicoccus acidiphilus]|nr:GTPase [Sulfodiicoccus acidiphilus]
MDEGLALAETAGYEVVEHRPTPRRPNPNYYISESMLQEVKEKGVEALLVFAQTRPRQLMNLSRELMGIKVLDKVLLLLEVFDLHAGSAEAKMQIELASLKYRLPILRDYFTRAKAGEQQGPLGAGTYGVEAAIKLYSRRMVKLKRKLEEMREAQRATILKRREMGLPQVAIVGYTNAGKTSLFNRLTGGSQKVDSSMFTTISPKRTAVELGNRKALLIDTVGFIRGIPPQIVEAFHVTLSEAALADVELLVVDSAMGERRMIESLTGSLSVFRDIGISGKPLIVALNKADKLNPPEARRLREVALKETKRIYSPVVDVVPVSAANGTNLGVLIDTLSKIVSG